MTITPEQIEEIRARVEAGNAWAHSVLPGVKLDLAEDALALLSALEAANKRMAELEGLQKMIDGVKEEATAEGRGFWKPCTGCHESEMGQTTLGGWSKMFGCEQGVGCLECGGLGVLWDSEDYEDMAEWMRQEDKKEAGRKAELAALRARVAELEGAVMKLRAALKPFADVAEWDIGDSESDRDTFRPMDPRCSISGNISIGHLRRALEAVEESEWVADKIRAQQTNDDALKGETHEAV